MTYLRWSARLAPYLWWLVISMALALALWFAGRSTVRAIRQDERARVLWELLEKLEGMEPETPIWTFRFKHMLWRLPINVAFTFKVQHLRYVAESLIGPRPS